MGESDSVYLVTKQYGASNPHERSVFDDRDRAAREAMDFSGFRSPADLSHNAWTRIQGNQHKPTRWKMTYRSPCDKHWIHVYVRKMEVTGR